MPTERSPDDAWPPAPKVEPPTAFEPEPRGLPPWLHALMKKTGLAWPLPSLARDPRWGLLSLAAATYAASVFVKNFWWLVPQYLHPVRLFDYPPGEGNFLWVIPCSLSIIFGIMSRKTIWARMGIFLSLLVILGIMFMVHLGLQQLDEWS